MNQPVNYQTPTRKASYTVQPPRSSFPWPWRLGLIALNLVGLLLVSMVVFTLVPVAHAMTLAQSAKPTPTATNTPTPVPTPTVTPTPAPALPLTIDPNSVPDIVLRNTVFILRGTAPAGACVRIIENSPNYPNPEVTHSKGSVFADESGQWAISVGFTLVARYWVQAQVITDDGTVSTESAKLYIDVSEPPPTPTNTPTNTPTPVSEAGPTATPTAEAGV